MPLAYSRTTLQIAADGFSYQLPIVHHHVPTKEYTLRPTTSNPTLIDGVIRLVMQAAVGNFPLNVSGVRSWVLNYPPKKQKGTGGFLPYPCSLRSASIPRALPSALHALFSSRLRRKIGQYSNLTPIMFLATHDERLAFFHCLREIVLPIPVRDLASRR